VKSHQLIGSMREQKQWRRRRLPGRYIEGELHTSAFGMAPGPVFSTKSQASAPHHATLDINQMCTLAHAQTIIWF
jgi:hypothetical protein